MMRREDKIPVIDLKTFGKSYFKDKQTQEHSSNLLNLNQHFQVNRRCVYHPHKGVHRLDFYLVFLVTGGEGIHTFGLRDYYIRRNMLCFAGPDMMTSWRSGDEEQLGFLCAFSHEFFNLGQENKFYLHEIPFFQIDGPSVLHLTDEQVSYHRSIFELMINEYKNRNSDSEQILRSLLHALLEKAFSQYHLRECHAEYPDLPGLRLLKSFTSLYMEDFKPLTEGNEIQLKKISDYADRLGVSQGHLNEILKEVTGKSAGQLIKTQLIKHATMYLKNTTSNVSEVAYLLGYEDPAYFSRFYKKQTGIAPSDLKKQQ